MLSQVGFRPVGIWYKVDPVQFCSGGGSTRTRGWIQRRELPWALGSSPIWPCTLVASTTWSLRPPARALPTICYGLPLRVNVGSVHKVDPRVEGAVDDADRLLVVLGAPGAEHHGAEGKAADLGYRYGRECRCCMPQTIRAPYSAPAVTDHRDGPRDRRGSDRGLRAGASLSDRAQLDGLDEQQQHGHQDVRTHRRHPDPLRPREGTAG